MFIGLAAVLTLVLAPPDVEGECSLAADVAEAVAPGAALYHNISQEYSNGFGDYPWRPNCTAVFRRRRLAEIPPSDDMRSAVGARFDRPIFQDADHATILVVKFARGSETGAIYSAEGRGGRWLPTSHGRVSVSTDPAP